MFGREGKKKKWLFFALSCLLMLTIFAVDLFLPQGYIVAVLYVGVIMLSLWIPGRRVTILFAILCSILTVLGYFLSVAEMQQYQTFAEDLFMGNRMVVLVAIWMTTLLALKRTQQRMEAEKELLRMSIQDELTHVYNRRYFSHRLAKEWARLKREHQPISLIMIDVDFFKLYNDTLGHQAGDDCLKQVAEKIDSLVNRGDDFVARYGGEEFVVMLPRTPLDGAVKIAKDIKDGIFEIKRPHPMSTISNYVTVSMGIACLVPTENMNIDILMSQADNALYQAKQNGRDRFIFFENKSQESSSA